ncbi:unnamed protein product [Pseudo-nitzschia multistriata]|uniref:Uncharacterized protein n=1 Tax=Pseudo-nitzschia multistriata TaxID=183589 RepID=A0A448ZCF6_9STRA|nr:unnamed protein product [Pseudo-nitzschia multistriata]
MATKKLFHYPDTPTTVTTAASLEERFDRPNVYGNIKTIAMHHRLDNTVDFTSKSTATSNSILEEQASVPSLPSRNDNRDDDNNVENANANANARSFRKSQAALQKSYQKRREAYRKLPLSVRTNTGINLKNLHPLAVRNGEFC